jgi:beta-lactamase regulating signal transducer with metallopeptidase domain
MTELAFPLLGTLVVFLVAVPAMTLVSKAILVHRRKRARRLPCFGSNAIWLLMIAPVIAPVVWFISAALHQSEPGGAAAACLNEHLGGEACQDALALALGLTLLVVYIVARRTHIEIVRRGVAPKTYADLSETTQRLARLCAAHPRLRNLRVSVNAHLPQAICTFGLLRPRIEVSTKLLGALDDDALTAALLHEAAHVRAFDPLRYFILSVCQSLNPLARMLGTEWQGWRLAREAACDEEAVRRGGEPLSLAEAILTAARYTSGPMPCSAASLGDGGVGSIQLRVELLLGYAEGGQARIRTEVPLLGLATVLAVVAALPHVLGSGPLDSIHLGIETTLVLIGVS